MSIRRSQPVLISLYCWGVMSVLMSRGLDQISSEQWNDVAPCRAWLLMSVVECVWAFCEEFVVEVCDCFSVFAEFEHCLLDVFS